MLQGHMICAGWSHWAICLSLLVGQDSYGCLSGAPDVGQSLCLSSSLCPFGPKDVAQDVAFPRLDSHNCSGVVCIRNLLIYEEELGLVRTRLHGKHGGVALKGEAQRDDVD